MLRRLIRLAFASSAAASTPWVLANCGDDSTTTGGADSSVDVHIDRVSHDAPAHDGTMVDVSTPDSAAENDAGPGDATLVDSFSDADADADADASDVAVDTFMGIPCTPPSGDAGEAGDAGDASKAAEAGEAGEARDAGDAGDTSDAAPIGTCPAALTCCSGWCIDTTADPRNCGGCGNACSSNQFCTRVSCDDAVLKNVCDNAMVTVVDDPYSADNATGAALGAALMGGCGMHPGVVARTTDEDSGVAQDPGTGRPLLGPGETLVAGGGYFGQASVSYMEQNALVSIYSGNDGTNSWIRKSKTNTNIVYITTSTLTMHHDYFVLEVGVEPVSGTLCFYGYGLLAPGTAAAAYYFQNDIIGNLSTFSNAWYVYEWTDTNMDGTPSAGDMFTQVSSGL